MAYVLGSLGDLISGTQDAAKSKDNVVFVPKERKNTVQPKILTDSDGSTADYNPVPNKSQFEDVTLTSLRYEHLCNSERRLQHKNIALPRDKDVVKKWNTEEEESRTVIVKNLPNTVSVKAVKVKFMKFGDIDAIRLRCAAREDLKDRKRVAVIKKKFHPKRTNICAFIRYKDLSCAEAALKANGHVFKGYHIFVHRALETKPHDQKKAIFVGNLPFDAEENDLYDVFKDCGEIDDIRIVRDKETGIGKGFAYVNFKSKDAVELALRMTSASLKDRVLRVQRSKVFKKSEKRKSNMNPNERNHNNKNLTKKVNKRKEPKGKKENVEEEPDDEVSFPRGGNARLNESSDSKPESRLSMGKRKNNGMSVDFHSDYKKIFQTQSRSESKQKPQTNVPFQGKLMTDKKKKKKKKINKEDSKKRKIAALLTNKK